MLQFRKFLNNAGGKQAFASGEANTPFFWDAAPPHCIPLHRCENLKIRVTQV
jgi:hypothetical protein